MIPFACHVFSWLLCVEAAAFTPSAFNVVATEHSNANCTSPTGNTEIVSGGVFLEGPNDGSCYQLPVGDNYMHRTCLDDGSVRWQTYAADDTECSGDVYVQITDTQPATGCVMVEAGGFYYRRVKYQVCRAEALGALCYSRAQHQLYVWKTPLVIP